MEKPDDSVGLGRTTERPGSPLGRLLWTLLSRKVPCDLARAATRAVEMSPVSAVCFSSLRRLDLISAVWISNRGLPIDRRYIEEFLAAEQRRIRGRVNEVPDHRRNRRSG